MTPVHFVSRPTRPERRNKPPYFARSTRTFRLSGPGLRPRPRHLRAVFFRVFQNAAAAVYWNVHRNRSCSVRDVRNRAKHCKTGYLQMLNLKEILLPVDFSDRSEGSARYAQAIASRFSSHIILLHVEHDPFLVGSDESEGPPMGSIEHTLWLRAR